MPAALSENHKMLLAEAQRLATQEIAAKRREAEERAAYEAAVLKQQRLPKRLHRWVRNLSVLVLIMTSLSIIPIVLLALSGLSAIVDGVAWYTPLRIINGVVLWMGFPLIALNSCQTLASTAAVVSELRDLAALIESCEESSWGTVVIPAAKNKTNINVDEQLLFAYEAPKKRESDKHEKAGPSKRRKS